MVMQQPKFIQSRVKSYVLRRPQNFAKSPPYSWLRYIQSNVSWRSCKIFWPSQNISTLITSIQSLGKGDKNINYLERIKVYSCMKMWNILWSQKICIHTIWKMNLFAFFWSRTTVKKGLQKLRTLIFVARCFPPCIIVL